MKFLRLSLRMQKTTYIMILNKLYRVYQLLVICSGEITRRRLTSAGGKALRSEKAGETRARKR